MKRLVDPFLRTLTAAVIYIILLTPFIGRLRLEAALITFVGFLVPVFVANLSYDIFKASRKSKD